MTLFYNWQQILVRVGVLVLLAVSGWAQVPQVVGGYACQQRAGTYLPLVGGVRLPDLEADKGASWVPLGFAFGVADKSYSMATISPNGYLYVGPRRGSYNERNSAQFYQGADGDWLAAPLWASLSGVGGQASYLTTGSAPNRVFTMEWRNWRWDAQAKQASISFQVRLYETSNRVEFAYQPEEGPVAVSAEATKAVIGLWGPLGTVAVRAPGSSLPTFDSDAPRFTTRPPAGCVYAFEPGAAACPVPLAARLRQLRRDNAQVSWTRSPVDGVYTVHYGRRGFERGSADDHAVLAGAAADTAQLTGLALSTNYEFYVELNCGAGTPGRSPRVAFSTRYRPFNDEGSQAQVLLPVATRDQTTEGTTTEATPSLPPGACGTGTGVVRDVWYWFAPKRSRQHLLLTQLYDRSIPLSSTTVLEVRDGWSATSDVLGCAAGTNQLYTDAELLLDNLQVGRPYFVRVYSRSPGTSGTSFRVALLETGAPPANDLCVNAIALPANQPYGSPLRAGTVQFATPTPDILSNCSSDDKGVDVWYSFVAAPSQELCIRAGFEASCELYSPDCGVPLPAVGPQVCFRTTVNGQARLRPAGLVSGTRYLLRISNEGATARDSTQNFALSLTSAPARPANDDCAGALTLPLGQPVAGTLAAARPTAGLEPGNCAGTSGLPAGLPYSDVWYRFTAPATPVALVLSANCLAQLEVRPGTCAGASLACAIAQPARESGLFQAQPAQVLPALVAGAEYLARVVSLQVDTMAGREFSLVINPVIAPPNDEPATAIALPVSPQAAPLLGTLTGSIAGATPSRSDNLPDIWYKLTLPEYPVGVRVLRALGQDVVVCAGPPTYEARLSYDGQPNVRGIPAVLPLNAAFRAGQTCYIRVVQDSHFSQTQPPFPDFVIGAAPMVANDEPCGALPLLLSATGECAQPVHGTTLGATFNTGIAVLNPGVNCTALPNLFTQPDVWYRFRATSPTLLLRCADDMVQQLRVFAAPASCADELTMVGCQSVFNNASTAIGTALFDNLRVGQEYLLAVSGYGTKVSYSNEFTLCAQATTTLPTRPSSPLEIGLWPNPVRAGELLTVQVPAPCRAMRAEWLSLLGQRLPGTGQELPVAGGQAQVPTAGRPPGLYLLRLWLAEGQPPLVRRVLVQ